MTTLRRSLGAGLDVRPDNVEQARHPFVIGDHRRHGTAVRRQPRAIPQRGKQRVFLARVVEVIGVEPEELQERHAVVGGSLAGGQGGVG